MPIIRNILYGAVRYKVSLKEMCTILSIAPQELNDSSISAPFETAYRAWEVALEQTGDKLLGLHLGEAADSTILGLIGHLMQSSKNLEQAFENVCKYNEVVTDMFHYRLKTEKDRVVLLYEPVNLWARVSPESARQAVEQAMAGTLNVFQLLSGKKIIPKQATFSYPQKQARTEYERVFSCPLAFSTKWNSIVFSKEQLVTPVISYDESLFRLFDGLLADQLSRIGKKELFSNQIRKKIITEFRGQVPAMEIMASQFHLTSRTFQRKLSEEKLTYRQLIIELKREWALKLLKNPSVKISEVANALGYSDPVSFQRAFKSWVKVSPGKMKKTL